MEKIKVEKLYFSLIWQRPTAYQNPLSYAGSKLITLIALWALTACKQTPEPSYPWLVNTEEAYCLGKDTVDYEVWLDTLKHRVYADCMDGAHPYRPLAREFSRTMEYHYNGFASLRKQNPNYYEDNSFFGMGVGTEESLWTGEVGFRGFEYLGLVLRPSKDTVFYLYKVPYIGLMNYLPSLEKDKYSTNHMIDSTRRLDGKDMIYSIKHTYYVRVLNRILQDNPAFHGRVNQARISWLILLSLNSRRIHFMKFSEIQDRIKDSEVPWVDLGIKPDFTSDSQILVNEGSLHNLLNEERMLFVRDFLDTHKLDFLYYSRNSRYSFGEVASVPRFKHESNFFLGVELDYKLIEGREIPFIKDCLLFCPRVMPSTVW